MRAKSLFLRSLKKMDFFGVPIRFTLHNKTLQKSYFGGLLSILLFSILIAILHQSILSLLYREQVTTFSQETNYHDPPRIDLESFPLNFAMSFSDKRMNNGTYFKIDFYQVFSIFSKDTNRVDRMKNLIPLEKCTTENFRPEMQNSFLSIDDSVSIKTYICPKKDTLFYVQGSYADPDFTYLQIKVSACRNSSSVTCVSQADIDKVFSDNANKVYLDFYVTNNIINPKNFNNPVSSFFDDKMYIMLDRQNYKEKNFYLTKNVIMTDNNFLDSYYQEEFSTYTYENLVDENTVRLDSIANTTVYAGVFFRAHSIVKTHYRSSSKVGTLVSYIGGLWSIMYFFLGQIGEFFNNKRVKIKLANSLYDFKDESERKRLVFPEKTKKNDIILNKNYKEMSFKGSIEEKIRRLIDSVKELKMPYDETFIWRKYFSRNRKNRENIQIVERLREKAKKAIQKDLDVVHLLRKTKSSDKLRNLILNKDQNFVFDFFHKTEINYVNDSHLQSRLSRTYDSLDQKFYVPNYKKGKIKDLINLYESYDRLKNDLEKNNLNEKIINGIRPEILKIFSSEEKATIVKSILQEDVIHFTESFKIK